MRTKEVTHRPDLNASKWVGSYPPEESARRPMTDPFPARTAPTPIPPLTRKPRWGVSFWVATALLPVPTLMLANHLIWEMNQ